MLTNDVPTWIPAASDDVPSDLELVSDNLWKHLPPYRAPAVYSDDRRTVIPCPGSFSD